MARARIDTARGSSVPVGELVQPPLARPGIANAARELPREDRRESDIVETILRTLAQMGIAAWRANTGAAQLKGFWVQFGRKGQADIQGVLEPLGRALWVECKRPGGKLRPEQEVFRASMLCLGAEYLLAESVDDVLAWYASRRHREQLERRLVAEHRILRPGDPST